MNAEHVICPTCGYRMVLRYAWPYGSAFARAPKWAFRHVCLICGFEKTLYEKPECFDDLQWLFVFDWIKSELDLRVNF